MAPPKGLKIKRKNKTSNYNPVIHSAQIKRIVKHFRIPASEVGIYLTQKINKRKTKIK